MAEYKFMTDLEREIAAFMTDEIGVLRGNRSMLAPEMPTPVNAEAFIVCGTPDEILAQTKKYWLDLRTRCKSELIWGVPVCVLDEGDGKGTLYMRLRWND